MTGNHRGDCPNYRHIAGNIKARRNEVHMSQEELAEKIDVSARYMSYIETARREVSLKRLCEIAKVLGTTLDPLVYGGEDGGQ